MCSISHGAAPIARTPPAGAFVAEAGSAGCVPVHDATLLLAALQLRLKGIEGRVHRFSEADLAAESVFDAEPFSQPRDLFPALASAAVQDGLHLIGSQPSMPVSLDTSL